MDLTCGLEVVFGLEGHVKDNIFTDLFFVVNSKIDGFPWKQSKRQVV